LCFLHISTPKVHVQEDGCSVLDITMSSTHFYLQIAYTDARKTFRTVTVYTTVFLKMNLRDRNM